MPQAPNVEGLPFWLQIALSLLFGGVTLSVGLRGYLKDSGSGVKSARNARDGSNAGQIVAATIADMGAIRALSDRCIALGEKVDQLEETIREQTHHDRIRNDLLAELNSRLRQLVEKMDRRAI